MNFYACKFYITYACNSRCAYCNIWSDDKYKSYPILPLEQAKKKVDELYEAGVRYIDFTGGEPALYPGISDLLQYTKAKGIVVEFTTNGLAFERNMDKIIPHVDNLNVSLDTLDPEVYKKLRGLAGIEKVFHTIQAIKGRGKPVKLIAVMTNENEKDIERLLEFSQKNRVSIYFSPLFDYFPMELERKMSIYTFEKILQLFYSPFAIVYLHFLKFLNIASANSFSECSSNKKILTLHPDGSLAVPCYHHCQESLPTEKGIGQTLLSDKFKFYQDNTGRMEKCKGCTVFPYLGVSFSYHFNRMFFYQAFSEEYQKIKMLFLNECYPELKFPVDELSKEFLVLERLIESSIPNTHDDVLFYEGKKMGERVDVPFFQESLLVSEYVMDNLNEYCWNIEYSPHTGIKYFYKTLLPYLKTSVEQGHIDRAVYLEILQFFSQFHIQWWSYFIRHYYVRQGDVQFDVLKDTMLSYIHRIMKVLLSIKKENSPILSHLMLLYVTLGEKIEFPNFAISRDLERTIFRFAVFQGLTNHYRPYFSERYQRLLRIHKNDKIPNPVPIGGGFPDLGDGKLDKQKLFQILDFLQGRSTDEFHHKVKELAMAIDKEKIQIIRDSIEAYETEHRPELWIPFLKEK